MHYKLWAFGSNDRGQLGIPHDPNDISTHDKVFKPREVHCLHEEIKSISGGAKHTLILTDEGSVLGAGDNTDGQLGSYRHARLRYHCSLNEELPQMVPQFEYMYTGIQFCAAAWTSTAYVANRKKTADIFTEGTCLWGELARGRSKDTYPHPAYCASGGSGKIMTTLEGNVVSFAAGTYHYVAIMDNGDVYGWGKARNHQLGDQYDDPSPKVHTTPTKIINHPSKWKKVVCGMDFTLLLGDTGADEKYILGGHKHGLNPLRLDITRWKDICATWNAIFVLFEDGSLVARGKNKDWELVPPNLPRITQIAASPGHVVASTSSGEVITWGFAEDGQCGPITQIQLPVENGRFDGHFNTITGIPGHIIRVEAVPGRSFVLTEIDEPSNKKTVGESSNAIDLFAELQSEIEEEKDTILSRIN
ncbi:RCC1/BLIP-II, partial [Pleomassaria siparia CBS 279.74]